MAPRSPHLRGASVDAAVVEAAYRTLSAYFPSSCNTTNATCMALGASLLTNYNLAMAAIPAGPAKVSGSAVGLAAANSIVDLRTGDGRLTPIGTTSSFATQAPGPGVWRLTPPAFLVPQTPWDGSVQPFLLKQPGQFKPEPPGSADQSGVGSAVQRDQGQLAARRARFVPRSRLRRRGSTQRMWFGSSTLPPVTSPPPVRSTHGIRHGCWRWSTPSAPMLFMSALNAKYQFLFWRPVTAIAGAGVCPGLPSAVTADGYGPVPGFDDGNAATVEDPCWRPLITTPNHPEYPAAHGTNTSAMAEVFTEFLGTDQINLNIQRLRPRRSTRKLRRRAPLRHRRTAPRGGHQRKALGRHPLPPIERGRRPTRTEGRALRSQPRVQLKQLILGSEGRGSCTPLASSSARARTSAPRARIAAGSKPSSDATSLGANPRLATGSAGGRRSQVRPPLPITRTGVACGLVRRGVRRSGCSSWGR